MVTNIEDAIKLCKNTITLCGVLSELNIDIRHTPSNEIILSYKGVVDVCKSYISFYGKVNNNSTMFTSIVKELNSFEAEVKTKSENGEIIDTQYSDKASVVYMRGSIISPSSIRVDYISSTRLHPQVSSYIIGVYLGQCDNTDKILIINPYYHNIIPISCDEEYKTLVGSTVYIEPRFNAYDDHMPPIEIVNMVKCNKQISQSVITQARLEHDIYLESLKD